MNSAARQVQKLWGRVQITFGTDDIDMAHICRQPGQASVEIYALGIPPTQTVNREGVAQVIRSRSDPAAGRFQSCQPKKTPKGTACGLDRQAAAVDANEEASVSVRWCVCEARSKVSIEFPS